MKKSIILLFALIGLLGCSDDNNSLVDKLFFGNGDYETPLPIPTSNVLTFNPASIDFGTVQINTTQVRTIEVTNTFEYPVAIDLSLSTGSNNTQLSETSITIPSNGMRTITVTYSPTVAGFLNRTIIFRYGYDPQNSSIFRQQQVGLNGQSVTQLTTTMTINPTTLNFGNAIVGQAVTRNVTLTNTGTAPAIWSLGNTQFSSVSPNSGSIPVGGSQVVALTFTPTSAGLYNGNQTFLYNGGNVQLSYQVNRIAATRIINLSSDNTAFGNVPINTTRTKVITITNTGNSDLSITSVTISQSPVNQFTVTNFAGSIPPNGSQNVTLSFRPTSTGSKTCTVTVNSNKTSGQHQRSFNGFGTN